MNSQATASWLKIKWAKPAEITKREFIEKYIEEYDHTYESDYYGHWGLLHPQLGSFVQGSSDQ